MGKGDLAQKFVGFFQSFLASENENQTVFANFRQFCGEVVMKSSQQDQNH